jgi:hypothetical protein
MRPFPCLGRLPRMVPELRIESLRAMNRGDRRRAIYPEDRDQELVVATLQESRSLSPTQNP